MGYSMQKLVRLGMFFGLACSLTTREAHEIGKSEIYSSVLAKVARHV